MNTEESTLATGGGGDYQTMVEASNLYTKAAKTRVGV